MQDERPEPCPRRELITAFAHDKLDGDQRREAERLLEQSEPCRELFRQLTAGRYPRWPNYTIVGQVGKGGFGVVYKAIHHDKERVEALKVLFSKTPLLTSYFQNEVHLIARLRHPNIATLFEAQLSTPPLYYTMEFVEGERLNDYLKRHAVSLAERVNIIRIVALAIEYAHVQDVVHRDLKPQNVLIDDQGQPHIVDFGIAKRVALAEGRLPEAERASEKGHEGPVGTLGYIAPEQEKGGAVDARADIFALGALLFHCVTGEPARLAKVADQRIAILRERQITRPEDLSAIVGRCVEDTPGRRYPTCAAFAADLDNYLAGRPIAAHEGSSSIIQAVRILALVVRDRPYAVRMTVLALVIWFLTWLFWTVETRVIGGSGGGDRTVMIAFTDETVRAIEEGRIGADLPGLDSYDRKSWRMLYGRLMERLAESSPLVVVWDGWFSKCSAYDEYFVRGLGALDAPVIAGARRFYADGAPEMCESIRTEIDGYGALFGADTGVYKDEYEVACCIQRGLEPPIPGLALAAFAAARFPDCDRRLRLDADKLHVYFQYRKRDPERRLTWEEEKEGLPLLQIVRTQPGEELAAGHRPKLGRPEAPVEDYAETKGRLEQGDMVAFARVKARPNSYWEREGRMISFEQVLDAETKQLKQWFDGRAIVIGHMRAGSDQHTRADGEGMFGCQVHADAVDALLGTVFSRRFSRGALLARSLLWCGLAAILVSLQGGHKWRSLRRVTVVCLVLFAVGAFAGVHALRPREQWLLEVLIAITGLLTAGSLTFWAKAIRERQLGLTPSAITLASEGPTLASTVLAETR